MIYLDDILVFSSNIKENTQHVRQVLTKIQEHGLYAKSEKCEFDRTSVEFLGYVISTLGITMDTRNVKTIQERFVPTRVRDVQSFLGFANFYHHFIKGFLVIAQTLIALTHKDATFEWIKVAQKAFDLLKQAFTMSLVLLHPDLLGVGEAASAEEVTQQSVSVLEEPAYGRYETRYA